MKVLIKLSEAFTIEAEGEGHRQLFENAQGMKEIFGISQCGVCNCKAIVPSVRIVEKEEGKKKKSYTYYEMVCRNPKCRAKLSFGCLQDGINLFPKTKDEDKNPLPNGGWSTKFVKYGEEETAEDAAKEE